MKCFRLAMISMLLVLGLAASAFAAKGDKELDFSVGFATAPASGFDTGWGLNVGGGYEFLDNFTPSIAGDTLQLRGDIAYHSWSQDFSAFGTKATLDYNRVPVTASCRYYYPIKQVKNLRVFGQAGLEISFDSIDTAVAVPNFSGGFNVVKQSSDETNVGVTPGVGVEYLLNRQIFVGANMKEHIISNPYFTMQGSVGFRF